jgi:hypothetical protein
MPAANRLGGENSRQQCIDVSNCNMILTITFARSGSAERFFSG